MAQVALLYGYFRDEYFSVQKNSKNANFRLVVYNEYKQFVEVRGLSKFISKTIYQEGFNRLTSIISSSILSSSALSMLTAPGLPKFGIVAVIGLIFFLSLKEILSASKFQGKALESSLNMGIGPLLVSFIAILVYKIAVI